MDVIDRVRTGLACSALDRQLAGLLLFGLDPALIFPLARWLKGLLGEDSPIFSLGPRPTEDALWEEIQAAPQHTGDREAVEFMPTPGPLAGWDRKAGIVLVPDLASLSLPAARAAVILVGADVAHLERSGVSKMWRPRDRWLASLRLKDAASVAPHLLDRFSFRLDAADLVLPRFGEPVLPEPDPAWVRAVRGVSQGAPLPALSDAAADLVVASVPAGAPGARRLIALGRVARALAGLTGEPVVLPGHVQTAAEIVGLRVVTGPGGPRRNGRAIPGLVMPGLTRPDLGLDAGSVAGLAPTGPDAAGPAAPGWARRPDSGNGHVPVISGDVPEALPVQPADDAVTRPADAAPGRPDGPYPEDETESRREAESLHIGWQQRALAGPPRGYPIGVQQARNKRDIAVVATLLQAARYQRIRRGPHSPKGGPLLVLEADLRSYRRAPLPGHLLVLLLDHTCRIQDWDWYQPLAPYLGWAYVTRALVGVVEVGARTDAGDGELRATRFQSRSLLDPRVSAALDRRPGRATPLAHGLVLAEGMLRHGAQPGSALVGEAFLVVITDGRANVPLAASLTGVPVANVGGTAIRDALLASHAILPTRAIRPPHQLHTVVIDPGPRPYSHLTASLAEALGASLVHGTTMAVSLPDSGVA